MNIVEIRVTQVTLPDGTRAWFESKETAEAVGNLIETVVKMGCGFGGKKVRSENVKVVATPKEKKAKKEDKPKRKSGRHTGTGYAEKTCGVCGNPFTPKSGRQKVCDDCKKAGWKTGTSKKPKAAKTEDEPSDALKEIRKAAAEAGLRK